MTPTELKALITGDQPALSAFNEGRHAACAIRCSEIAPKVNQPVPAPDIQYHAALTGIWAGITIARESTETPTQIRGVCITFLDWIKSGRAIDFSFQEVQAMLGGLIQSGLATQQQAAALESMGQVPQQFTTDDVQAAMRS